VGQGAWAQRRTQRNTEQLLSFQPRHLLPDADAGTNVSLPPHVFLVRRLKFFTLNLLSQSQIDAMIGGAYRLGAEDDDSDIAPVLPNLQIIDRERREREASTSTDGIVAGLDCRFCQDAEFAREWLLAGPSGGRRKTRDPRSTPVLLSSYFRWLSWLLKNASQWCVSLRLGRLLGGRRHLWSNGKLWRLSVEDPFEAYNSLVRVHMSLARVFICRLRACSYVATLLLYNSRVPLTILPCFSLIAQRPHDLGQVVTMQGQQKLRDAASAAAEALSTLHEETLTVDEMTAVLTGWGDVLGLERATAVSIQDRLGPSPVLSSSQRPAAGRVNGRAELVQGRLGPAVPTGAPAAAPKTELKAEPKAYDNLVLALVESLSGVVAIASAGQKKLSPEQVVIVRVSVAAVLEGTKGSRFLDGTANAAKGVTSTALKSAGGSRGRTNKLHLLLPTLPGVRRRLSLPLL